MKKRYFINTGARLKKNNDPRKRLRLFWLVEILDNIWRKKINKAWEWQGRSYTLKLCLNWKFLQYRKLFLVLLSYGTWISWYIQFCYCNMWIRKQGACTGDTKLFSILVVFILSSIHDATKIGWDFFQRYIPLPLCWPMAFNGSV